MGTLIKNCRLISPDVEKEGVSIRLEKGLVERIFEAGEALPDLPAGETVYNARGKMALPGFLDIHFHGAMGFDVTDATAEAMARIAQAKLEEGVTAFCPTTLTLAHDRLCKTMERVAAYQGSPAFSRVAGVHVEGPYINPDCAGAQNRGFIRKPDMAEIHELNTIAPVAIVSYAIEMEGALDFTRSLAEAGMVPSVGHSAATYEQFLQARKAGLRHLTHFTNQMSPLNQREIGLVGGGLLHDDMLLEVICDKVHLSAEMVALVFKVKPMEKIALVSDATCGTGLPDGEYELGGLAVKVEQGQTRLVSNNALAGSTLRFNQALKNAHEITGLPLKELVKTTSWNQARSLGLERQGKIEPGFKGDLVILDDAFKVQAVFMDGEQKI